MVNRHKRKSTRQTFRSILNKVAPENANKLMRRARIANQLAKSLHGRSRVRAYAVKTRAVLGLTVGFPDRIRICIDFKTPGFLLVKAPTVYFGLHVPAGIFEQVEPCSDFRQKWRPSPKFAKIKPFDHPGFGVIRSARQA